MKGIVISTKNEVSIEEFAEPLYKSVGKAVGGNIEVVHPHGLPDPYIMVVNEEGLLRQLPLNPTGCVMYGTADHGHPIVGDIVIMKEGFTDEGRDFVDFRDSEAKKLTMAFIDQLRGIVNLKFKGGEK